MEGERLCREAQAKKCREEAAFRRSTVKSDFAAGKKVLLR